MNPTAVRHAKARLATAAAAVERVAHAHEVEPMLEAWTIFLVSTHTIYNKLARGARGHPASELWYKNRSKQRDQDPLLRYIHKARSDDEHGILDVAHEDHSTVLVSGTGTFQDTTENASAEMIIEKYEGQPFAFRREFLRLGFVPDERGKPALQPPTTHMGKTIANGSAFGVGRLAIVYLSEMIQEAEALSGVP